jgi:hypothetical protein
LAAASASRRKRSPSAAEANDDAGTRCQDLTSIEVFARLENLKQLRFENCELIDDISPVAKLKKLENLGLLHF